mmetsp:Transcript_472/g.1626  ORF Transcript_472/g.1626 Transcript_472/m.1626 type:complete len:352 (+) Transcript_472:55-1110(+)
MTRVRRLWRGYRCGPEVACPAATAAARLGVRRFRSRRSGCCRGRAPAAPEPHRPCHQARRPRSSGTTPTAGRRAGAAGSSCRVPAAARAGATTNVKAHRATDAAVDTVWVAAATLETFSTPVAGVSTNTSVTAVAARARKDLVRATIAEASLVAGAVAGTGAVSGAAPRASRAPCLLTTRTAVVAAVVVVASGLKTGGRLLTSVGAAAAASAAAADGTELRASAIWRGTSGAAEAAAGEALIRATTMTPAVVAVVGMPVGAVLTRHRAITAAATTARVTSCAQGRAMAPAAVVTRVSSTTKVDVAPMTAGAAAVVVVVAAAGVAACRLAETAMARRAQETLAVSPLGAVAV